VYTAGSEMAVKLPVLRCGSHFILQKQYIFMLLILISAKVTTHATASLTSLHVQSFCTRTHKIPSPPHGTSTLEQAPVCSWNMSSSDDDAMGSLWLLLSLCARENHERRNVTCGVKTGYEKENLLPH
jgi:hypothetical protein